MSRTAGTDYPLDGSAVIAQPQFSAVARSRRVGIFPQAYGNPYGYARVPINSTGTRQLPSKFGAVPPPRHTRTYFPTER